MVFIFKYDNMSNNINEHLKLSIMYKISAEFIITTFFAEVGVAKELTLSTLAEIKQKVDHEFFKRKIPLQVDLSRDSIESAIYPNRKYFSFDDSRTIIKFNYLEREDFYEDYYSIFAPRFNSDFNTNVKFQLQGVLEDICTELVAL